MRGLQHDARYDRSGRENRFAGLVMSATTLIEPPAVAIRNAFELAVSRDDAIRKAPKRFNLPSQRRE
jgi:hypothetical protein